MFILEIILETLLEGWAENRIKKNKPHDANKVRKILKLIIIIVGIILITAIFIAFFALIEWLFPNLFDVVRFN